VETRCDFLEITALISPSRTVTAGRNDASILIPVVVDSTAALFWP